MNFNVKYNVFYFLTIFILVEIYTIICSKNALTALAPHEIESALVWSYAKYSKAYHKLKILDSLGSIC